MIHKIGTIGLYVLFVSLFLSCNQQKVETEKKTVNKAQVMAEIQAIENKFALTFNNRNTNDLDYYAEDAISYFAAQEPIEGKEAIHRHIEEELMDFPEGGKITFETLEVYVDNDGIHVAEIGSHRLHDSTGTLLQRGHYMSFFRLENGKYFCVRDMANSFQVIEEE